MAKTNLEAFEKFLKAINSEVLTPEQFKTAFSAVSELVKKNDAETKQMLAQLRDLLNERVGQIKDNNTSELQRIKEQISQSLVQLNQREADLKTAVDQRLAAVRDGLDADEDAVVDRATERVKNELFIPTTDDLLNDVPTLAERIRDALELLRDDDRLDVSAIKGIEDMLKDIDRKIGKAVGAIKVPSPVGWTRHQSIACSSGTTVYSLDQAPGHAGKAAIVRYEGQVLTETTHYSISGTDVTLTFDPNNSTQLDITYWPF